MRILKRVKQRLHFESHWRCAEPVVVIESDDWGMDRKPCGELLSGAGEVSDWAMESTESCDDLDRLFQVLAGYHDRNDRPACMTANFIMSNPDYSAIAESRFLQYHHVPLDVSCPTERRLKYRDGMEQACFVPQYHGLRHFHPRPLLADLESAVPGARELFAFGAATGLAMVKGHLWRYHSEYQDCRSSQIDSPEAMRSAVNDGLGVFERFFGFRSESTIPPHYLVSDALIPVLRGAGIAYLQGANYQIQYANGRQTVRSHALGERSGDLVLLSRNVKLEDRPNRKEGVAQALENAHFLFDSHVPVVLDTHRINYTGQFRDRGLKALDAFLSGVAPRNPIFLSSAELGAAISGQGEYMDTRNRTKQGLTPLAGVRTSIARKALLR